MLIGPLISFNEQEMGVVRYYRGLISKKLFNEQEVG